MMKEIKKLNEFLTRKGVKESFASNFENNKEYKLLKFLILDCQGKSELIIKRAFEWSKTKEGWDEWEQISKEWENEININNKNKG